MDPQQRLLTGSEGCTVAFASQRIPSLAQEAPWLHPELVQVHILYAGPAAQLSFNFPELICKEHSEPSLMVVVEGSINVAAFKQTTSPVGVMLLTLPSGQEDAS